MLKVSYSLSHGIVLSLSDLRRVLATLCSEGGRWWIETLPAPGAIRVCTSHAGPDQATDELSFSVPVVTTGPTEDQVAVCLHPELIEPQVEGLYLEQGRIKSDFIEDWLRFWRPLERAVLALRPDSQQRLVHYPRV